MPGMLEEAILALAYQQPLYIIGHFGGAAKQLGILLGLSNPGETIDLKAPDDSMQEQFDDIGQIFTLPGIDALPLT